MEPWDDFAALLATLESMFGLYCSMFWSIAPFWKPRGSIWEPWDGFYEVSGSFLGALGSFFGELFGTCVFSKIGVWCKRGADFEGSSLPKRREQSTFSLLEAVVRLVIDFGALLGGFGWPIGAQREQNYATRLENGPLHLPIAPDRSRIIKVWTPQCSMKQGFFSRAVCHRAPMPCAKGPKPQPIDHKRPQRLIP